MIRWLVGLIMIAGFIIGAPGKSRVAWSANSCVACHKEVAVGDDLQIWYQNQFIHWYGSVHGRKDVTCEKCHGGNPGLMDKRQAHQGIKSSKDPKSPIYYKNLPETCGSCHKGVYQQFIQSHHYKNLKTEQLVPTCTTCHGFEMDIGAVRPLQLVGRCTICHNTMRGVKPEVADLARQSLEEVSQVEQDIQKAQTVIDLAREEGLQPTNAEEHLRMARSRLQKTGELWHTFQLDAFKKELMEIRELARKAYSDAKRVTLSK